MRYNDTSSFVVFAELLWPFEIFFATKCILGLVFKLFSVKNVIGVLVESAPNLQITFS